MQSLDVTLQEQSVISVTGTQDLYGLRGALRRHSMDSHQNRRWIQYTATKITIMHSFSGVARPQSQIPHPCVCERFMYSQDRSTIFPAAE
jgi:hypothetical protein